MHYSCQNGFSILISALILVIEVWMVVKEFSYFGMACFNELIIGISQGFAFQLKIITQMVKNYVNFQWHCLSVILHECEPCVSEEFNLFSVINFHSGCMCHSVDIFDLFQSIHKCVQILWQEISQKIQIVQNKIAFWAMELFFSVLVT